MLQPGLQRRNVGGVSVLFRARSKPVVYGLADLGLTVLPVHLDVGARQRQRGVIGDITEVAEAENDRGDCLARNPGAVALDEQGRLEVAIEELWIVSTSG